MDVVEQAAEAIFQVFLAEQWARFSFAVERDGGVFLDIPEDAVRAVAAENAPLGDFLTRLAGQPVDAEASMRAIVEHAFESLSGTYTPETVMQAFDSPAFGQTMELFSGWLAGHERLLELEVLPLAEWRSMFATWRSDPSVVQFIANRTADPAPGDDGPEND